MIAVDTSALVAILFDEEEAADFTALIQAHGKAIVGAPTAFEFRMVARGQGGPTIEAEATKMLKTAPIEVVAFDAIHADLAAVAFSRFGKKRHPADLNFGDCQTYAIARREGCPLLFKGNDFRKTDLPLVA